MATSQIPATDPEIPQTSTSELSDADSAIAFPAPFVPYSRKEKRQLKKQKHDSAQSSPSNTDTESRKPPNNPPKNASKPTIPAAMPAAKNALQTAYPLLICSIGNPGSTYASTLHSAGHILTSYLAVRKSYRPFTKGLSGQMSTPDTSTKAFMGIVAGFQRTEGAPVDVEEDWTFWQSTSLMNVSGRGVSRAYTEWMKDVRRKYGDQKLEGRLVVVHDELESSLGKVTVRDGSASAKGHNGLKSCQSSLGKTKWWRVGVGIGRPESREPDVVARYVLKKMNVNERKMLENSAVGVFKALEEIAAGQR
jgi:PTH1 family peptidyl-tRNA hydrolase